MRRNKRMKSRPCFYQVFLDYVTGGMLRWYTPFPGLCQYVIWLAQVLLLAVVEREFWLDTSRSRIAIIRGVGKFGSLFLTRPQSSLLSRVTGSAKGDGKVERRETTVSFFLSPPAHHPLRFAFFLPITLRALRFPTRETTGDESGGWSCFYWSEQRWELVTCLHQ